MRYTDGFLRRSSSGKYVGVLKHKNAGGTWHQKTKTFTSDRSESELLLAQWRFELTGRYIPPASCACPGMPPAASAATRAINGPTVEEAVRRCLGAQLARGRIERSTYNTQIAYCERELFPELGNVTLATLTPAVAQAWVDRMCLRLAPGSVRLAFSALRKTCAQATVRGELANNPLDLVEPPPRPRPTRSYLPDASVEMLERALERGWGTSDWRTCAARLALYAGLRAGECCALRWRDVDLVRGRLRVAASVGRSTNGPYLKPPKCAASAREFPATAALVRALEARQGRESCDPASFVCGSGESFADPRSLSTAFARICDREGITDNNGRRATFHVLRHTFATRAVRAGVDVRTLADLMGHARADVTLNVYAASGEDAMLAAVGRLDEAFDKANHAFSLTGCEPCRRERT